MHFVKAVRDGNVDPRGDRDGEVPVEQSVERWHGLVAQHVPTKLVVDPQDGDRFIKPADAHDSRLCALEWFEQFLAKAKSACLP